MVDDPYATHLPVLEGLSPKPRRVLEFGGGYHSTEAFLDMDSVTKLVTVETDPEWRRRLTKRFEREDRWKLIDGSKLPALDDFDLVFIDDGADQAHRIQTIGYVLSQRHPRVVIHDADHGPYQESIDALADDYRIVTDDTPWTAVVEKS